MNVLGVWDGHDAGAVLLVDGHVRAAMNEERFTRRKHDHHFPSNAVAYCLREGGLTAADLDYVGGKGRNIDAEYFVSNNFAFGGINTSLVFKRMA